MTRISALVAAAISMASTTVGQSVYDLSQAKWTVANQALNISVPGSLPSEATLDLRAANVIPDPLYGLNDFNLRWIPENNWTYSAPLDGLSTNASSTWLLFNGLNTYTSIYMCGCQIATTDNQFRQYYFDVTSVLKSCSGTPDLSINFGSTTNISDAIAMDPGVDTWPAGVQLTYEFPNRWFSRVEQSSFGWDWGPAFAPTGPWQPAWVVQMESNEMYVTNTLIDIYKQGQLPLEIPDQSQPWVVNASFDFFGTVPSGAGMNYVLMDMNNKTVASGALQGVNTTNSTISGYTMVANGAVDLWWPSGMGAQNLYWMELSVVDGQNNTLACETKRTGFRTIVLNEFPITQEQLSQGIAPGNNWHFEINGQTFYAKGSNFIPPDAFWPNVTEQRIQQLFQSVIDGNQNMLRVWASGSYSPDFMYDLADEMGILLWSEFEFGDALYPVNQEFVDNVAAEVYYQIRRINRHPSLSNWMGGNELENLELAHIKDEEPDQLAKYTAQYELLFIQTIFTTLYQNSRSISYSPSSTSNGWQVLNYSLPNPLQERYFNTTPGDVYGETDYYNYDANVAFNTSTYPVGRFSNEFGFHSMPSIQTWQQAVPEDMLYFNSSVVTLRDHHNPSGGLNTSNYANSDVGQGEMTMAVQYWYPIPEKTDSVANFSAWCHATQIYQADLYSSEIQFYRRGSGFFNRQLGSPTWAGIEYDGRWKVLHYIAKDIYKNVIISPFLNRTTGEITAYVTSDLWNATTGTANFTWYDWSGNVLNVSTPTSVPVNVGAINSSLVWNTTTAALSAYNLSNVVLRMSVETTGNLPNQANTTTFTHENWLALSKLNEADFVDPGLTLAYDNSSSTFTVEATKGVAAWVWLDYPAGVFQNFDSNGFWLAPNEPRTIQATVKSDTTNGAWVHGVTVQSMWNQTQPELQMAM